MEYSSGRNKTFLCYLVDKGNTTDGLLRGYLEDEHTGSHAEEAFFDQCLPHYDPALKYTVTWYIPLLNCQMVCGIENVASLKTYFQSGQFFLVVSMTVLNIKSLVFLYFTPVCT